MSTVLLEKKNESRAVGHRQLLSAPIAIYEERDFYVLFVELIGVDEKSVQVRLEKGVLTVEAKFACEIPRSAKLQFSEICLGDYRRSIEVGDQIDENAIDASLKSGLLRLHMPKSKVAKARQISIKKA